MVLRWLALISVALSIAFVGCVLPSTRRTHDENMAKAEAFKRVFDRELKPGASFDEVLEYLKPRNLHFGSVGLTAPQDEPPRLDGAGRLWVEMFREESPNWYCGKGSVGLSIYFANSKFDRTEAAYWSFDCP